MKVQGGDLGLVINDSGKYKKNSLLQVIVRGWEKTGWVHEQRGGEKNSATLETRTAKKLLAREHGPVCGLGGSQKTLNGLRTMWGGEKERKAQMTVCLFFVFSTDLRFGG